MIEFLERNVMRSIRLASIRRLGIGLIVLLGSTFAHTSISLAQLPQARLHSIFPPGGQIGTTVELRLSSGADLDEVDRLSFNHPDITAVQKMQESGGKQQPVANTFVVTIGPDVPAGLYEARAAGYYGLTNPRTFVVGQRPEVKETEPNNAVEQATAIEADTVINAAAGRRNRHRLLQVHR